MGWLGMHNSKIWKALLGVEKTVIENMQVDEDDDGDVDCLVASVRPTKSARNRCGKCGRKCRGYDQGEGRRKWRTLDLGTIQVFLEAEAPRVKCRVHGVIVAAVPWARHDVGHTYVFDQSVAWLVTKSSKSTVRTLMRVAWHSVGAIVTRVNADVEKEHDRFENVRRIGIDEISYKRHHNYLTVVVDHDSGDLLWAGVGRSKATLEKFFDLLGEQRCELITHVSADGADWIASVVENRCENAVRCADPFHIIKWATEALDQVRQDAWKRACDAAESAGEKPRSTPKSRKLKNSMMALRKGRENLNENQVVKLAWVAKTDRSLYRAYLLKERLRMIFKLPLHEAIPALESWIGWARRSRIPQFVHLQRRIIKHKASILASIEHGLTNGRVESMNTKIRLITRVAFGFTYPKALIALAMLSLGAHSPVLPGRK